MEKIVELLDGAMGTMIQNAGIEVPEIPELLNLTHPELILSIARQYEEAGAQIVYANTFGASPLKLAQTNDSFIEVIQAGIQWAHLGAPQCKVALDIGPLGVLMEPMGTFTFEEAYAQFKQMVLAGKEADLIVIETMSDLLETKAAILAAKENSPLPVFVTMSFEESGRTFTGCTLESMVKTLEGLGVDALGFNCSIGPNQMIDLVKRAARLTSLPIIAKPNAGLPDPATGKYTMDPADFALAIKQLVEAGASYIGGCCGTNPSFIRAIAPLKGEVVQREKVEKGGWVCSSLKAVKTKGIHPIGERINPTGKKRLQQALLEEDLDYVVSLALQQQEAGAEILDINIGYPGIDEVKLLPKIIRRLQSVIDLPLLLDSSNPEVLKEGARIYNGLCALNSTSADQNKMDALFPIAQKYGCSIVCLTLNEEGIPQTAQKRVELAELMAKEAMKYAIPPANLWFDPLTLTLSAQPDQAQETLQALEILSHKGYSCTLGVSNISFGLPARKEITRAFLAQALGAGLNLPIINVNVEAYMDTIVSCRLLANEDPNAAAYIARFSQVKEEKKSMAASMDIYSAIYKGLDHEAVQIARSMLASLSPFALIEEHLIPALDQVGKEYEAGTLFLPQLLSSAQAAQGVFEIIKEQLANTDSSMGEKKTIVLATVEGDIHDIGKNIVKTVLENYGYSIIDLGRDVAWQTIVDCVQENQIKLVGLSALMTTTLPAMEQTIKKLHALENPPKIMVGGAVLTRAYAQQMGADYYSKDAQEGVRIAQEVFQDA